jgi:hypothetical protein
MLGVVPADTRPSQMSGRMSAVFHDLGKEKALKGQVPGIELSQEVLGRKGVVAQKNSWTTSRALVVRSSCMVFAGSNCPVLIMFEFSGIQADITYCSYHSFFPFVVQKCVHCLWSISYGPARCPGQFLGKGRYSL